ncbi:putative peptidase YqhT [[Clostridium] cellulosi]|uniref:Putative peptidase YqhT n=1 Tax=[Clostridium] cellulosi TaxID=29343 RepID=A0A078KR37_9FIRM|nr:MAG: aminopeptidase P family protein [[Clostridium] cellulosi]CDZ23620.1 putative peptidase YqhT [[Clostridium] cellulosi]
MSNIQTFQSKLKDDSYAAIIYSEHNRYYFTGFPSSDGLLFITKDHAVFLIDSRYIEAAKKQAQGCEVVLMTDTKAQLAELVKKFDVKEIGIESYDMPVSTAQQFKRMLPDIKFDLSDSISETISHMRMIKSDAEIENIKKAQAITDAAFDHILEYIKPGVSERDIALEIEYFMKKNGAKGPSFDLITITGENTSLPHGVPGDRKIKAGDFFTMDTGAVVNGYCSDMTRTVAVGKITSEQKKVYDTVLKAQTEALNALAAGKKCSDIDKIARDIIDNAGYKGCFGHGLGHSVGLLIHEEPRLSPSCDAILEPGMIMTVEPGIYLEGRFGVRIEDMVLITKDGIINFSKSPKELITL